MKVETFAFDAGSEQDGPPLKMAAKRYTSGSPTSPDSSGLTLLMMHGLGQHKEFWEPVLEKLFALQAAGMSHYRIREAWAFDWQSHGDSAILNADRLRDNPEVITVTTWASGLALFIKSGRVDGHTLVGVGYSAGTIALMISAKQFSDDLFPYSQLILVEPILMDEQTMEDHWAELDPFLEMMKTIITHRRDAWTSKDAAFKYFNQRPPWTSWDPRIVSLYADHGLQMIKDKEGRDCAVRKCSTHQEASAFLNHPATWEATSQVARVCAIRPVHVIFGEIYDLSPRFAKESTVDPTKDRVVASVTRVPNVGHLILQEKPDILALTMSGHLNSLVYNGSAKL